MKEKNPSCQILCLCPPFKRPPSLNCSKAQSGDARSSAEGPGRGWGVWGVRGLVLRLGSVSESPGGF